MDDLIFVHHDESSNYLISLDYFMTGRLFTDDAMENTK